MFQVERTLRVLSIDEQASGNQALERELERLKQNIVVRHVSSLAELENLLHNHSWNLIVSDYNLSSLSVGEALLKAKAICPEIPFVLLSDQIGEEIVADLMHAGLEDVVLKNRIERLSVVVKRVLREHETKNKEARAQKIAHEAFAAREQMVAIVSHDIKNPLSAIQLEAQMLLRASARAGNSVLAEEVKIQANRILKTTDRMKTLISDLLDKNKSANGLGHIVLQSVNVNRLVQDVLDAVRPLIQEKNIIVRTMVPEGNVIQADRNKLFQVFCNLVSNAIKFTPEAGTIQISMEDQVFETSFTVEDSGEGLRPSELEKIFEKYWSGGAGDSHGTGLGLFICKSIIESHGGHIQAENLEAGGARFSFTLPKSTLHASRVPLKRPAANGRKRIMIVDDDDDLREVISWALSKEGHAIQAYHSPLEAMENLKLGLAPPDLIIVDYHMDEMKGSKFVELKHDLPAVRKCPLLMISASPQEAESDASPHLYWEMITKPIDLEGLVEKVNQFLQ